MSETGSKPDIDLLEPPLQASEIKPVFYLKTPRNQSYAILWPLEALREARGETPGDKTFLSEAYPIWGIVRTKWSKKGPTGHRTANSGPESTFMPSEVYQLIEKAIREKKQVHASYHGKERWLCPHILGYDAGGEEQALFYQFAGGSRSGLSEDLNKNWRCMEIHELRNVKLIDGEWHSVSKHSRPQNCVVDIQVVVER